MEHVYKKRAGDRGLFFWRYKTKQCGYDYAVFMQSTFFSSCSPSQDGVLALTALQSFV